MKQVKKFAGILMILAIVLSISATALADGEKGTIIVDNPQGAVEYVAYKIFDVTYSTEKNAYSYTISGDSVWFGVVATKNNDGSVTPNIEGLSVEEAPGENTYVIVKGEGFSAAAFANTLKEKISDGSIEATGDKLESDTVEGKTVKKISGLDLGYYFVTSSTGALCNLTTTNPTVTIHDKNDVPFEKKGDLSSVEVGETVNFTITGKVPDTTGFDTYTYKITDTMTNGLTFNKNVSIKIGDTDVTKVCTSDYNEDGFELSIPVIDYQGQIGATITVTYTAIVNENAVTRAEKNSATLTYGNDPTTTTETREVIVYSAKLVIDKYASEDKSKKLEGATFVLYRYALPTTSNGVTTYSFVNKEGKSYTESDAAVTGSNLVKIYYKATYGNSEPANLIDVSWYQLEANENVQTEKITSITTGTTGEAVFAGLENGTYYLEEIKAPNGYNPLEKDVEVIINGSNTDLDTLTVTQGVANNAGSILPSTGGIGTTVFYVLGSVMMVGATVLLVSKKRMSRTEK